jgi:two-component system, OmpR family, phosphate regulon sensor histidine kinase PhoR
MTIKQTVFYCGVNGFILYAYFTQLIDRSWLFIGALSFNALFVLVLELKHKAENRQRLQKARQLSLLQEKNLQIKSSQLETITSNLPFPMALIDHEGNLVLHNTQFQPFIVKPGEPMTYLSKVFQSDIGSFIKNATVSDTALNKIINIESTDYQAISIPIVNKSSNAGCLFMFLDITKILEGERMQKRFIADASHELKTPLSVILGMIQILNRPDFSDPETLKEFLGQIETESLRMENIINDLLSISKLSSNRVVLNPQPIRLKKLIQDVVSPLKPMFTDKQDTLLIDIDDQLMLHLDVEKTHQIFSNLLTNALKFTEKGTITITSTLQPPYCVISVRDTGIGIKEEDQKYIFERFYRADHSRSRTAGGSGLGLAIVKAYVLAHKGEIELQSKVDEGSCFTVKLPL